MTNSVSAAALGGDSSQSMVKSRVTTTAVAPMEADFRLGAVRQLNRRLPALIKRKNFSLDVPRADADH
ncbi:hypothetical protein [Variovorax sp. J31P179]|uniref:hypothetical protein n=1 Tax=Variovorax sp. J31P179 TaxID=3053508 RepID=UPI00257802A3|nr:hypothetical protein [Variovorax sp. J31P179]